jgi:cell division protein FtsB
MTPIALILVTTLLGLMAWIGKEAVAQLKSIATSVNQIKVELSVLVNDHQSLKERVEHLEDKIG